MIPASEVVARARSQIALGTIYTLGKGGYEPTQPRCADSKGRCDCTGFAAWCFGVSRKTDNPWYVNQNGGWFESTAIMEDCKVTKGMFDYAGIVAPGMLFVWGDSEDGKHQGHVGLITVADGMKAIKVVHCSSGNFKATGDAIQETGPEIFLAHRAVVAECGFVNYSA